MAKCLPFFFVDFIFSLYYVFFVISMVPHVGFGRELWFCLYMFLIIAYLLLLKIPSSVYTVILGFTFDRKHYSFYGLLLAHL